MHYVFMKDQSYTQSDVFTVLFVSMLTTGTLFVEYLPHFAMMKSKVY